MAQTLLFALYEQKTRDWIMTGRSDFEITASEIRVNIADIGNVLNSASCDNLAMQALSNRLHSTLDFNQLIVSFIDEVRRILPCDGIEYRYDTIKLYYTDGVLAQHSCKYGLRYDNGYLGELCFTRQSLFQEHELTIIELIVGGLIPPLHNALRYHQALRFAQRDELTGLRNGSYYHDSLEMEIRRAHRYNTPFSLLLLDLDNFNGINETHGRAAGDAVLVEMAGRIERAARASDIVFRSDGDRFLVFLPNTGAKDAAEVADRIKRLVLSDPCIFRNSEIRLTLSIGVVMVSDTDTRYKLIERADRALFHAKVLGKDRIHVDVLHECIQEV
jgi:diguanylate cyclase (GGDEF)-like protein